MKIKLILTVFISTFMFIGCDSDLDIPPRANISPESLYVSEAGFEAGLNGVYGRIVAAYREMHFPAIYPTTYTDEGNYTKNNNAKYLTNNFTSSEPALVDAWSELYIGIKSVNVLLDKIDGASFLTDTQKNYFKAQGRFVRAYMYLDLQRAFGGEEGIPLPLTPDSEELPRTKGVDVYKQIVKDLEFSEKHLLDASAAKKGRPSKSSARGLLARTYLYMAGNPINESGAYEQVKFWTDKIIYENYHVLNPSYRDIFDQLAMEEYEPKEMLFQIGFAYNLDNNQFSSKLGSSFGRINEDEACAKAFEVNYAAVSLILNYRDDPNDERGMWNTNPTKVIRFNECKPVGISSMFRYSPSKYRRELETDNSNGSWGGHHWPVLRYADVLLMSAEAEFELNGQTTLALDRVNAVRTRAKATLLPSPITKENIIEERRLELCFEGLRRYDLVRWDILEEKVIETKNFINNKLADPAFENNNEYIVYGRENMGPDGLPNTSDELNWGADKLWGEQLDKDGNPYNDDTTVLKAGKNVLNTNFENLSGYINFDISKHYILPIPSQEVGANEFISQSKGW